MNECKCDHHARRWHPVTQKCLTCGASVPGHEPPGTAPAADTPILIRTAVLVERGGDLVPGVVCKTKNGEYLVANVYWPEPETPDGFEWGGWYKRGEVYRSIEEAHDR